VFFFFFFFPPFGFVEKPGRLPSDNLIVGLGAIFIQKTTTEGGENDPQEPAKKNKTWERASELTTYF